MKNFLKKYKWVIVAALIVVLIINISPKHGPAVQASLLNQIVTIMMVIPPIFILLGLFDVWVPREVMIGMMGEDSGLKGFLLSFFLGSAAAGPLYGAFPVAAIMMKKGAGFNNVIVFIGAWSTTKIPMFLFELHALGHRFAIARLIASIIGITLISFVLNKALSKDEKKIIYKKFDL